MITRRGAKHLNYNGDDKTLCKWDVATIRSNSRLGKVSTNPSQTTCLFCLTALAGDTAESLNRGMDKAQAKAKLHEEKQARSMKHYRDRAVKAEKK